LWPTEEERKKSTRQATEDNGVGRGELIPQFLRDTYRQYLRRIFFSRDDSSIPLPRTEHWMDFVSPFPLTSHAANNFLVVKTWSPFLANLFGPPPLS
jgi:hypothetical protein